MSKCLRDTEHCQREILKLKENLSEKVDSLSNSTPLEPDYLSSRTEINGNLQDLSPTERIDVPGPSNEYSNICSLFFRMQSLFFDEKNNSLLF